MRLLYFESRRPDRDGTGVTRGDRSCHHYDICGGLDWLETSYVEIEHAQRFAAVSLADEKIQKKTFVASIRQMQNPKITFSVPVVFCFAQRSC